MPAKYKYYDAVLRALVKDGWTITDEEVHFVFGDRSIYVDLMAERPVLLERMAEKIAVEARTFAGKAKMADIERAIGQFVIYETALEVAGLEHELFLAVPIDMTYFFTSSDVVKMRRKFGIKVVTYDPIKEVIVEWIK